jgi:hypothetical protein
MQMLAADLLWGMTPTQMALLASGAALIFALKRWRQVAVHQRAGAAGARSLAERARASGRSAETAEALAVGLNRPMAVQSGGGGGGRSPLSVRELTVEIQALLGEVEETARRAAAQVDNRYRKLEQLVLEADDKIQRLEALMAAAQRTGARGDVLAATGGAELLSRLRQERGAPSAIEDPAYQPIYRLADAGRTPREIAQELGRQPGEVELILALRKRAGV